jgi:hypothetical protein
MSQQTTPNPTNQNPLSEAQLHANQQNAKKSTGPKTESGKQRSRINATRHGLTGQFHAFSHEDKIAFDEHCTNLMADFQPATYREKILAMSISEDQWRLNRARALENNIFAIGVTGTLGDATDADSPEVHTAISQARVWLTDGPKIQLLSLYETRIRRNIEKNEKQLAELQARRQATCDKAVTQAKLFTQLSHMKGQPYDLTPDFPTLAAKHTENGFEFSTPQINRLIEREQRLEEAIHYSKNGWQPRTPYQKPGISLPQSA